MNRPIAELAAKLCLTKAVSFTNGLVTPAKTHVRPDALHKDASQGIQGRGFLCLVGAEICKMTYALRQGLYKTFQLGIGYTEAGDFRLLQQINVPSLHPVPHKSPCHLPAVVSMFHLVAM